MNYKKLKPIMILYISLPVFTFLIGYLRWYWAAPAICALAFAVHQALRDDGTRDGLCGECGAITNWELIGWFAFALLFTHLCGLNGFWYQTSDWNARNPIYKDIITRPWPVFYESRNTALSYYIGFWLVPAVPAKIAYALFGRNIAWIAGRIALWIWAAIGLWLLMLASFMFLNARTRKLRLITAIVILGFSGLDVVGMIIRSKYDMLDASELHIEWWCSHQISSITTCLCWVFNQTAISWLCILCFLMEKSCRNYLLIGVSCLFCGPIPFVGLVVLMVARFAADAIREKKLSCTLKNVFSLQNLAILIGVFPLIAMYLLSNNAASTGIKYREWSVLAVLKVIGFLVLEAGVYLALLWEKHKRDPLFYAVAVTLALCPFIRIGEADDFCMRASVPGVLMMALWSADAVDQIVRCGLPERKRERLASIALLVVLCVGAVTPAVELYRGFYQVVSNKTIFLENTEYDTMEDYSNITVNFETTDPAGRLFFRYFAKKLVGSGNITADP